MSIAAIYDVPAPAKLNLYLHVVGRRADGMHLLESLMVLIDWCDTIHVEPRGDGLLRRHDTAAALPADDLSLRAARALQAASGTALGRRHHGRQARPVGRRARRRQLGRRVDAARPQPPLGPRLAAGTAAADRPGPRRRRPLLPRRNQRLRRPASASGWCPADVAPAWFAVVKPAAGLATGEVFARPEVAERVAAARIAGFSEAIPGVDGVPGALGGNRASTCRRLRDERPAGRRRGSLPRGRTRGVRSLASLRQQPDDGFGKRGLRTGGKRPEPIGSDAERLACGLVGPDVPLAGASSARRLGRSRGL